MSRKTYVWAIVLALAVALMTIVPSFAQSTLKSLSTNFTLVNLGAKKATGTVKYLKTDGTEWQPPENFTLAPNGGQAIFRQYLPGPGYIEKAGRGSVVLSADQPLGAVAQILARGQDPTSSGAYSGFEAGATSFYVPLVARQLTTASGLANSQITVQNTGTKATDVEIEMVNPDGTSRYIKKGITIRPGASYLYDLEEEDPANVPHGWCGSAEVRATTLGGEVAVVSNFFTSDGMQTFSGFSTPAKTWFVPLFTSRLDNGLSTPIAVQNLSGTSIPADGVKLKCTPDPDCTVEGFTKTNATPIGDTASCYFNPVVDETIPGGFFGSCIVEASADVVSFVQMRFIGTAEAAAYEAIKEGGTKVIGPLVAKRLENGFATAVTIQNLSTTVAAHVDLIYTPSPEYVDDGDPTPVEILDQEISPGGSLIQNHRITGGPGSVPELPDGWYGTLVVESDGPPIAAFVQLTFLRSINSALPSGDNFMAHNAFTLP